MWQLPKKWMLITLLLQKEHNCWPNTWVHKQLLCINTLQGPKQPATPDSLLSDHSLFPADLLCSDRFKSHLPCQQTPRPVYSQLQSLLLPSICYQMVHCLPCSLCPKPESSSLSDLIHLLYLTFHGNFRATHSGTLHLRGGSCFWLGAIISFA